MLRFHLILFAFLAWASSALARTVTLSLGDAGAYAVRHNPGLAAARFRIEEARGRLQQAGRLTNPEVGTDFTQNVRTPERSFEIGLTQRFPITARLRLEKEVTRAELAAAEQEVRDEERKVIAQVRNAIVRLLSIASVQALRETQIANSRQIAEFTRKRVETAEASVTDATLVELEARQLEAEILLLGVERATLQGELRPLLGLAASDDITVPGALPSLTPVPGPGVNVSARPDLQAARATAEAARSTIALERARKWDDIGVGLALQSEYAEDAPEGFERDEFFGLRFSVPLPLWNDNSGRMREAIAAAARRAKEVDALALTIRTDAEAAREEMLALTKVVNALDATLIPMATQVEEQLRLAQSSGQTTLIEVLRARDRRFALQRQRIDALRDFHLARARYDAATARHAPARATRATTVTTTTTSTRRGK